MASKNVISEDDRNNQRIHLEKVKYLYDSKLNKLFLLTV